MRDQKKVCPSRQTPTQKMKRNNKNTVLDAIVIIYKF